MENSIKAILIDVDDCLLPTNGVTSRGFFNALHELSYCIGRANNEEFPQIGWCSGRDRNYIEAVSCFLGLPDSWSIIESGIALFNPTTKELIFNPALTIEIQEVFEKISRERIPQILRVYPGLFLYPGNMVQVTFERRYLAELSLSECYQVVIEALSDLIALDLVTIHQSSIAIDINPAGIDKASGVRFFAEKAGIGLEEILGIGDSKGDFPLLQTVGYIGCPANASDECKELVQNNGGYIAPDPCKYATGVVEAIRHFMEVIRFL